MGYMGVQGLGFGVASMRGFPNLWGSPLQGILVYWGLY